MVTDLWENKFKCLYSNFYFILSFGISAIEKNIATKQVIIAGKLFSFIILFSAKSNAVKEKREGDSKSVLIFCFL